MSETVSELVRRLRAPAYWMSGSSDGHEGENYAPLEAADRIQSLTAERDALREAGTVAWLVEFPQHGDFYSGGERKGPAVPTQWLSAARSGHGVSARTSDANKAIRFCRQEDAEAMILYLNSTGFSDITGPTNAIATEHMWIGAALKDASGEVG
jgi:hypothetical protein